MMSWIVREEEQKKKNLAKFTIRKRLLFTVRKRDSLAFFSFTEHISKKKCLLLMLIVVFLLIELHLFCLTYSTLSVCDYIKKTLYESLHESLHVLIIERIVSKQVDIYSRSSSMTDQTYGKI
jgi:hypothetical protein